MSDLPKGYLRCPRCTASFPGETEEKKPVERCPGCGFAVDHFRPRTARLVMRAVDPLAASSGLSVGTIVGLILIVLAGVGAAAFVILRR